MILNQTPDPQPDRHLCPAGNVIRQYPAAWCLYCAHLDGAVDIVTHNVVPVDIPWPLDAAAYEEDGDDRTG